MPMVTVGLVYNRIRPEEKLLLEAGQRLGIPIAPQNDSEVVLGLDGGLQGDVILSRSVSASRGLAVLRACHAWGLPAVNRYDVAAACADKAHTSWLLRAHGVPTPDTRVAFTPEAALAALDELGYPAVLKPTQGSWARLVARVDSRREAEQLLEHRAMLPNPVQHIYYVQAYVEKAPVANPPITAAAALPAVAAASSTTGTLAIDTGPGAAPTPGAARAPAAQTEAAPHSDLRAFVVGDETIACVRRISDHWVTNTARGARTEAVRVDDSLGDLCLRAANAVGGGVLAIDLMEGPDGTVVHEVNHTMEFRNSVTITGVDIPGRILQYAVEEARR